MLGAWAAMAILAAFVLSGLKVLREYQRAVVFRLGRVVGARGPGVIYVIPGVEKAVRIDLRTITMDIPSQDVITKDNVSLKVNAVLYFRVLDPNRAVVEVENYLFATSQLAQTTLRSVCGEAQLDALPDELIAQAPAAERTAARLLALDRASGALGHHRVADLPSLLRAGDLLVVNDTRVIPARVRGRRPTGAQMAVLFVRGEGAEWEVLVRGAPRIGERVHLPGASGQWMASFGDGRWRLR